jgi:UDP-N-acetylglucosamine 2-epimerase
MVKIMTIVGTRPEVIKMSRVISELDAHSEHVLVHTGQNFDRSLNGVFFDDLGIRPPDHYLDVAGASPFQTIAAVIENSSRLMQEIKPDALLLYGDTNSCLSVMAAKRLQIPIFHMEAGNRCFDYRVPEESNRKIVDHLSDVNLVLTEHARSNLVAEGIKPNLIFKTGSHMPEVLSYSKSKIERSIVLKDLGLSSKQYFLVSSHREENIDDEKNFQNFLIFLERLSAEYKLPVVVSVHPRTRKRIQQQSYKYNAKKIILSEPFSFTDYIHLQMNALCVISDSGTIAEEASLLGLPAVTMRGAIERPEAMDAGVMIVSEMCPDRLLERINVIITQDEMFSQSRPKVDEYENPHVSKQVVRIVLSYIDQVNRLVWSKP